MSCMVSFKECTVDWDCIDSKYNFVGPMGNSSLQVDLLMDTSFRDNVLLAALCFAVKAECAPHECLFFMFVTAESIAHWYESIERIYMGMELGHAQYVATCSSKTCFICTAGVLDCQQ